MKKLFRRRNFKRLFLRTVRHGRKAWTEVKGIHSFAKELLRNPRAVGAICPSGTRLAKLMASLIPDIDGLIIEIGAGTGAITQAILEGGLDKDRLLIIERSPELCSTLRARFPELNVVEGDATELSSYLPAGTLVAAVISSVPLMSLEHKIRALILEQVRTIVGQYGYVIQFTYAVWKTSPYSKAGFCRQVSRLVAWNVPPAKVECFRWVTT